MVIGSRNPHNHITVVDGDEPGPAWVKRWKCRYCGVVGTLAELEAVDCKHDYPPCPSCGQAPQCALDCPALMAVVKHARGETKH